MTKNDRIMKDLSLHLHEKIIDNIDDFMDLCRTAELSFPAAASELMVFFSHLAAGFAVAHFRIDEDRFIELMQMQFKRALKAAEDE